MTKKATERPHWSDELKPRETIEHKPGVINATGSKPYDEMWDFINEEVTPKTTRHLIELVKGCQFVSGGPGPLFGAGWAAAIDCVLETLNEQLPESERPQPTTEPEKNSAE